MDVQDVTAVVIVVQVFVCMAALRWTMSSCRPLHCKHTACLTIDLQQMSANSNVGILASLSSAEYHQFSTHLNQVVLPNVALLHQQCRKQSIELIHARIQSLTLDGRERSRGHKKLNLHIPPGSEMAQFLDQAQPQNDEIILNKTASGVFASTNLNYLLHNLEIKTLIICGAFTNECVSNAVRAACDLGYEVILVEDACIAPLKSLHTSTIDLLDQRYATIIQTAQLLNNTL